MWKTIRRNYRRLIASLLTMAMVVTNAGGNLGTIFAAGETENALFLVEGEEIREAIREAEEQGEVFDFSELHLAAKRKSIKTRYEKLLGKKEGAVYALNLEIDDSYAPEGTELQVFYNAGSEDVIFLFLNGSDLVVDYRVNIDGYETEPVRVNPNTANIEADGEDAPAYAEDYEAADMIDDETKKLGAEVLNPEETSGAAEGETGTAEDENEGDASMGEAGDAVTEESSQAEDGSQKGEKNDASAETEESEASKEGNADESDSAEEGKPVEEEDETESETESVEETEAETEAKEETEVETEAPEEEKSEAEDGELLSISRHEAAVVAISVDKLEDSEAEVEEEAEAETEEETEAEVEKETEARTETEAEKETEAETESESKADEGETEADETNKAEESETGAESGNVPEESVAGAETEGKPEESEAGSETGSKPEESVTGTENGKDITIEETGKDNSTQIPDEEGSSAVDDTDSDGSMKNDQIEMDGQLLEDDSVEILGELKGKEYDTVTVLDHVNARAWKIALEDIEAIISSEATDYVVEYQVNYPEGAVVKGADSVAEGENLYFAVEPEEGFETVGVYANGSEVEEVEDFSDLASASDWKGYTHIYIIEGVSEDLDIEIEMEELYPEISAKILTADAEDAWITVEVPDGAFDVEVDFQVEKISEDDVLEQLTSQAEEALEADQRIEGIYAYDIRFVTTDDEEVEPAKPIDVSISFKENAIPEEVTENATEVSIVHLPDDEDAKVEMTVEQTEAEELKFQAESFSVRMAVFTSRAAAEEYERVGTFERLQQVIGDINAGKSSKPIQLIADITATDGFPVNKGRTIKIDLHGKTLTYSGEGSGFKRLFYVRGNLIIEDRTGENKGKITNLKKSGFDSSICVADGTGVLNINGGTITSVGANHAVYVSSGTVVMNGGRITGSGNKDHHGGGIYIENGTVEIKGGSIDHNTAKNGGGIYAGPGTTVKVSGGIISENKSEKYDERGAYYGEGSGGGGIFTSGSMELSGGKISKNQAKGGGGGIYADTTNYQKHPLFSMTDGVIDGNTAADEGGGIYFGRNGTITGGSITNNKTTTTFDWGGGGIFIQSGVTVDILNALITANHADGFGGGVAGCPSGDVKAFTINGAAIFDNTASGSSITKRDPKDGKTDDQVAADDDTFKDNGYRDYYCENTSTVYGKMLGGGSAGWTGSAKQIGSESKKITIPKDGSQTATDRMGLNAGPDNISKQNARHNAQVKFSGNRSTTHGGAIMCNGVLKMGIEENKKDKINISGKKTWEDDNNRDGKRPASIVVGLYANGSQIDSKTVKPDANGNWNWTFSGVSEKDASGKKIEYTIKEQSVSDYTATIKDYSITNKHTPEKTSISGEKTWDDHNNQDGKRPDSITVRLYKNGSPTNQTKSVQADTQGKWSWTFDNLYKYENGKEIAYTVGEENVPAGYTSKVDGANITNQHIPEKIDISGQKIWEDEDNQDGVRPESITVELYKNGNPTGQTKVIQEDADGNWSWIFENLDKYENRKKIAYTVKEVAVPSGYASVESGTDIINKHEVSKIDISGEKTWDDDQNRDNKRPESITVRLFADDEEVASKVVTQADGWKYSFTEIPEYKKGEQGVKIVYNVREDKVEDYEAVYSEENYDIKNSHTPEVIDISGQKTWDDDNNRDGERPASITVELYADGEKIDTKEVTEADDWSWNFAGVPKYKAGQVGIEVKYTVQEIVVNNYSTSYEENTYNITNQRTPGRTSRTVQKIWVDSEDQDGIRPDSIQVQLMANGEAEGEPVVLNQENSWSYTWTDLYAKANGQDIHYTVAELGETAGYTTSYSENTFIITNTHKPAEVSRTVKKIWEDADNRYRRRPESIQVQLLADGEAEGPAVILNEENQWSYTWNNLPEKTGGQNIRYTVAELGEIEGYVVTYSEDTFTITNTYTVPNTPGGGGSSGGGGGSSSGGGGGSTSGGPGTTTIEEPGVPLANLPTETVTELIEDPDVPLAALPKTGDSRHTRTLLMMLGIAGLGMLLSAAGLRKSKEDSDD